MLIVDSFIVLVVIWFIIVDKKCMVCWKGYVIDSFCMFFLLSDLEIVFFVGIEVYGIE